MFPDLRIKEQGRIAEPVLGQTALAFAPVILALLTVRGQAVESVGGGSLLDRCPPANGRDVVRLSSDRSRSRHVRSRSRGEVGGVAGAGAPASGVGAQLCPSTLGGGAVASCAATAMPAGVVDPPAAPAAVPGSSDRQQRQEVSRSSRCRHRSSSDGTGRLTKK